MSSIQALCRQRCATRVNILSSDPNIELCPDECGLCSPVDKDTYCEDNGWYVLGVTELEHDDICGCHRNEDTSLPVVFC